MSEEQQNEENPEVSQPEPSVKEKPAAKKSKAGAGTLTRDAKNSPKDIKGALHVTCSNKVVGTMYDTDREVRIPSAGQNAVQIADVKAGSWLWCQMDAGLVIKVG